MSKNSKIVAGVICGVLVFAGVASAIFFYQKQQKTNELAVAQSILQSLAHDKLSFTGQLSTSSPTQTELTFATTTFGKSSKTDFTLHLPSLTSGKIVGELISVNDKSYLKIASVDDALKSLPDDPLSNAIKKNLQDLSKKYQDQWLLIDQKEDAKISSCLTALSGGSFSDEQIKNAYQAHPFIEGISRSKSDASTEYGFTINDQLDDFIGALTQSNADCSLAGATVKAQVSTDGSVRSITVDTDKATLVLSNISAHQNALNVETPQATQKFSDLKTATQNLFIP